MTDPADPDPQACPAQFARQQRRRRARDDAVAVGDLAGHHEVAGPQVGGQATARARHRQGGERLLAQRGLPGAGPARPVPGRHDLGHAAWARVQARIAQPAPDRPGLQPQRGADQQPGAGDRVAPGPRAGHLEPGHDRAARYRPSADTGNTSRYRW